jgi:glycerophosphoryl diester phosphodiesterase
MELAIDSGLTAPHHRLSISPRPVYSSVVSERESKRTDVAKMRVTDFWVFAFAICSLVGCGSDDGDTGSAVPANVAVHQRVADLAPVAVFAHRGQGPTRAGNPFPENSLAAFRVAIDQGTDGLEMDAELTEDGQLILMHDDTVDRTSECSGCVSTLSFDEIRHCRLLDGDGQPTDQVPPTLDEVFQLEPTDILVNVELKTFGNACRTPGHGPADLAAAMVATLRRLGVERRTLVQSFDLEALMTVKAQAPDIYTALLVTGLRPRDITSALEIHADAIQPGGPFPFVILQPELLQSALEAGLQVIPWTVDDAETINALLDSNVNGIITNDPVLVKQVAQSRG